MKNMKSFSEFPSLAAPQKALSTPSRIVTHRSLTQNNIGEVYLIQVGYMDNEVPIFEGVALLSKHLICLIAKPL